MSIDPNLAAQIRSLYAELTCDGDASQSPQVVEIQKRGVTDEHQRCVVADLISVIPRLLKAAEATP